MIKLRKGLGVGTLAIGLLLAVVAFSGLASAHTPSASGTSSCTQPLDGTWVSHFKVNNDPDSKYGEAKVSGTGTSLDGKTVPAAGNLTLDLTEPANVATVTLSGTLTWPKDGYHTTFSATVAKPDGCTPEPKKVWVCKYVGKPGVDESLKGGKNPISVSVSSIPDYQGVGSYFADAQGRSFVLAEDDGVTDHNASECPNGDHPTPPPSTVTTTKEVPGPTVTVTAPAVTVTVTESSTATETVTPPASTVTIPGPTTTVIVPGPTVTLTETQTATATATETQTATETATETQTATETATATETQTATATATQTVTATETVTESAAPVTVTETVSGPATTVTVTAVGGKVTQTQTVTHDVTLTHTATVTVNKNNCPPNAKPGKGGSTSYLSSTGVDSSTLGMIAGVMLTLGTGLLFLGRQRRPQRAH